MGLPPAQSVSTPKSHEHRWAAAQAFAKPVWFALNSDRLWFGGAALGFYLTLAIFPSMIFLLSLLPYLPLPDLRDSIMAVLSEALPGDAARVFAGTVNEVLTRKHEGMLSFSAIFTLWAASSGIYAIMRQLNMIHSVEESRPFWKIRGASILLTIGFGALTIGALFLVLIGGWVESWLRTTFGFGGVTLALFTWTRWLVILAALELAFALLYHFGLNVERKFRLISPGGVVAVGLMIIISLFFKTYVNNFGGYDATYGSLGAVIVLMLWLNFMGMIVLFGSEINALTDDALAGARRPQTTTQAEAHHARRSNAADNSGGPRPQLEESPSR